MLKRIKRIGLTIIVVLAIVLCIPSALLLSWCHNLDETFLTQRGLGSESEVYKYLMTNMAVKVSSSDDILDYLASENLDCGKVTESTRYFQEQLNHITFDTQISCWVAITKFSFYSSDHDILGLMGCGNLFLAEPVLGIYFLFQDEVIQDVFIERSLSGL